MSIFLSHPSKQPHKMGQGLILFQQTEGLSHTQMPIWFIKMWRYIYIYTHMYISVKLDLSPVKRGKRDIFGIRAKFFENLLYVRVCFNHKHISSTTGGRYDCRFLPNEETKPQKD